MLIIALWTIAISIVGAASFYLGYKSRDILDRISDLMNNRGKEEELPYVTNAHISPRPYNSPDHIVQPKSPQQIQNEAYEKIKRGEVN